jgi:hypothetical protein
MVQVDYRLRVDAWLMHGSDLLVQVYSGISHRSWGFAATSKTPWNFHYNFFYTMFQKERLGGYLEDGSRYVGFKIQLLRPYTFGDTAYTI